MQTYDTWTLASLFRLVYGLAPQFENHCANRHPVLVTKYFRGIFLMFELLWHVVIFLGRCKTSSDRCRYSGEPAIHNRFLWFRIDQNITHGWWNRCLTSERLKDSPGFWISGPEVKGFSPFETVRAITVCTCSRTVSGTRDKSVPNGGC